MDNIAERAGLDDEDGFQRMESRSRSKSKRKRKRKRKDGRLAADA
jgi:hypothetical protein